MPIILNMDTREYFVSLDENETNQYLHQLTDPRSAVLFTFTPLRNTYKHSIKWDKSHHIMMVPQGLEKQISSHYQCLRIHPPSF